MSNSLLTVNFITRKAVAMFRNSNAFLQSIDMQYKKDYGQNFKIGETLRIRLPVDYTVGLGQTVTPQSTTEQYTSLTVGTQRNVPLSFTSQDFALEIDDFNDRFIVKAVNDLASVVASDIMSIVDCGNSAVGTGQNGTPSIVANFNGSGALISPINTTWLQAAAKLDMLSADRMDRQVVIHPSSNVATVASMAGLFNPSNEIGGQYKEGSMGGTRAFGVRDWRMDQTVLLHTSGTCTSAAISGGSQTGTSLTVSAITGTFAAGDFITIEGVNSVNRLTKQTNDTSAQFVITSAVSNGGTTINIYPALIPPSGSNPVQYQTVTASPIDGATITPFMPASTTYIKNVYYKPDAFTCVTVDLPLPTGGVVKAARANYDGVSLRLIEAYDVYNDLFVDRLDILFGATLPKPDWSCVVADVTPSF